jgi:hypothetical protein
MFSRLAVGKSSIDFKTETRWKGNKYCRIREEQSCTWCRIVSLDSQFLT